MKLYMQSEMEKAADAADMFVLFLSAGANFRPRAWKTMREECFTHFIISTRAISTSAISINNAFFCRFFLVLVVIYDVLSQILWC